MSTERQAIMADSVSIAPDIYTVVVENPRVRVLEIKTKPGQSRELHSHPDMVLYAVADCDWKLGNESGESTDVHLPAGATIFLDAVTHNALDIGSNGSFAIAVELK